MRGTKTKLLRGALTLVCLIGAGALARPAAAAPMQSFPLSAVRLTDGIFKTATDVNRKVLDDIGAERALHCFRLQAKLPSSALPLGGWATPEPSGAFPGHYEGHYLSATALMYAETGDPVLKQRIDYMVAELAKCQAALGGKYLFASPPEEFEANRIDGVAWYRMHKVMEGIYACYAQAGNAQALTILTNLADWMKTRMDAYSSDDWVKIKQIEFGGMAEALYDLYTATRNPVHKAMAQQWEERAAMLDPLNQGKDVVFGHANTYLAKIVGAARVAEMEGDPYYLKAMQNFWEFTAGTGRRTYATGGTSVHEGLPGPRVLSNTLEKLPQETCVSYNMMKVTRSLFLATGESKYMDYAERLLFNAILGSQDPVTGWKTYYQPLYANTVKDFRDYLTGCYCCNGTGMESFSKLGQNVFTHDDRAIYVNLFLSAKVSWPERSVFIEQSTRFPEEAASHIVVHPSIPGMLRIAIRVPAWCKGFGLSVNGEAVAASASGGYAFVERSWQDGDKIDVRLPMDFSVEAMPDLPTQVAFLKGPIVMVGSRGRPNRSELIGDIADKGSWFNNLNGFFRPATGALRYDATDGAGRSLSFKPYYQVGGDEFFTGYFDVARVPTVPDEGNIALGRPTRESMPQASGDNLACFGRGARAVDGMSGSWYSKWLSGGGFPSWLQIDLEQEYRLERTEFWPPPTGDGDRKKYYKYRIEISKDAVHWEAYADRTGNTALAEPAYVDKIAATARYLRITLYDTPGQLYAGAPPDIGEFKAFGTPASVPVRKAASLHRFTLTGPGGIALAAMTAAQVKRIDLLDVGGRLVRSLRPDGMVIRWDGRDERGRTVPSGTLVIQALTSEGIFHTTSAWSK